MDGALILPVSIMAVFHLAATVWSARRARLGLAGWGGLHAIQAATMAVLAVVFVAHLAGIQFRVTALVGGTAAFLIALAFLLVERRRGGWLAIVQLVMGMVFAAGVPFLIG